MLTGALALPAAGVGSGRGPDGVPSKVGAGERQLRIVAWDGLLEQQWVKPFERKTKCKVQKTIADSSNQMAALMRQTGKNQQDLGSASGDIARLLIARRAVAALNVELVPGWRDFGATFKSLPTDTVKGVHYGIPLHWTPNELLYQTKQVKPAPISWGAIYDRRHRGKITVPNNPMQIADAALYLMRAKPALGIRDPYELTRAQLDAATALLTRQKPLLEGYWNYPADEVAAFKNGKVTLGVAWPWQALTLRAAKIPVAEVVPQEGITGWTDSWMLAAKAKHPNCAYRWLQYVSTPQVQAQIAVSYGAAPVNTKACPLMNRLQAGSCAGLHANASSGYTSTIRFWRTPLADCGNGRKNCVALDGWQTAWARLSARR